MLQAPAASVSSLNVRNSSVQSQSFALNARHDAFGQEIHVGEVNSPADADRGRLDTLGDQDKLEDDQIRAQSTQRIFEKREPSR